MSEWIEIILRSIGMFFVALLMIRILGKKNPTKMTPFKYINYNVLGIIITLISVKVIKNIYFGITALGIWFLLSLAIDYLSIKSKWVDDLVNGQETVLVKHGKVMEENLMQERLTGKDLLRELRTKNAFSFADVEFALMESNGDINVLLKSEKKPITPHDLGWKVAPQTAPQTAILDGNILDEALTNLGLNRGWLDAQLESAGVTVENVFIGQVDSSGDLYLDLFDDKIQLPTPQVKELIYANFEKSFADLMSYALETESQKAKLMYTDNAEKIKDLMVDLEPYLLR